MSYKNAAGNITINDVAANSDIQNMRNAANKLRETSAALQNIVNCTRDMSGYTADAIGNKATQLKKKVDALIAELESDAKYISNAVQKYYELDRALAQQRAISYKAGGGSTSSNGDTSNNTSISKKKSSMGGR